MSLTQRRMSNKSAVRRFSKGDARPPASISPNVPFRELKPGELLRRRSIQKKASVGTSDTAWAPRHIVFPPASPDSDPASEQNSKWSFLQRLMAIEEAHDQQKLARERKRTSAVDQVDSGGGLEASSRRQSEHGIPTSQSVPSSLWTRGQVLSTETPVEDPDMEHWSEQDPSIPTSEEQSRIGTLTEAEVSAHAHDKRSSVPEHMLLGDSLTPVTSNTTLDPHARRLSLSMSNLLIDSDGTGASANMYSHRKQRELHLPPILLPKIYTVSPRPLKNREFLTPTKIPGPITDREWEELRECRYIRQVVFGHKMSKNSSKVPSN